MISRTRHTRRSPPALPREPAIPTTALVASGSLGATLQPARAAQAIARGLQAGGSPAPDLCPLEIEREDERGALRRELHAIDLDARIHRARALIVACARLDERSLPGSAVFEVATRARQMGVPAYAVTADNRLSLFDARVLDLQTILVAGGARSLAAAGRKLAGLI